MIRVSLIYVGITIFLAFVDAVRIKVKWGKQENINHITSILLGLGGILPAILIASYRTYIITGKLTYEEYFIFCIFSIVASMCIRLAVFDLFLNLWRIGFKINPTMRLDYESKTTSSWIDQHLRLSFGQKRGLAVVGYAAVLFVYYKIY